ncbi:MAG TPA: hypothetical protein VFB97_01555, partial [Bacteroidales bacterium]|nr:hypothetical protein [Bacteroidales bacterium]
CTSGIMTTIGDPSCRFASFGMTGYSGSGRGRDGNFAQQNCHPFLFLSSFFHTNTHVIPSASEESPFV